MSILLLAWMGKYIQAHVGSFFFFFLAQVSHVHLSDCLVVCAAE